MALIELRDRAGGRPGYFLEGHEVRPGDNLEFLTPLGWVRGTFEWTGNPYSWARLVVPYPEASGEAMLVVVPPDARCRWPVSHAGISQSLLTPATTAA